MYIAQKDIERLQVLCKEFEEKFDSVALLDNLHLLPSVDMVKDIQAGSPLEHLSIGGEGDTADKAIDDWKNKIDRLTASKNAMLLWRVKPEIDCERSFDTQKIRYRVYSRHAIYMEKVNG